MGWGWFRLNELSVGSLTTTILLGVITFYLLSLKHKGRETWYLSGYLGSLFVLLFAYTVRYSVFSVAALLTGQFANTIVFGVACLIQFAYWFRGNPYPRESRIVLALTMGASIAAWGSLFAPGRFPALYDFDAGYFTYDFGPRISVLALVEYLWALVVFLRRAIAPAEGTGRVATSHRSFALLTLATVPIALQYVLYQTGVIARATYALIFNTGSLLICLLIFIVYVNNAPHPTSYLGKLVGIPLAVLMVAFGIASNAIIPVVERTIMERYRAETEIADVALATQELSRLPQDVVYLVPTTSELVALRYGAPSVYRPKDLLLRILPGRESHVPTSPPPRFHYDRLGDTSTYYFDFPLFHGSNQYSVGFSYAAYRLKVHQFAWRIAAVVVSACIVVVLGFPLFFRRSLVSPLRSLLAAVGRVSHGNFRETVEAVSDDEIGQLSHGYNRMITSLIDMEGNFKALAENAYDAILIVSGDGDILYANARAGHMTGLASGRLQGRKFSEFVHSDEVALLSERLAARLSGGREAESYESRGRRADGAILPIEVTAAPTTWQSVPAVVVIVRDVSERRRAEELLRSQQLKLMRTDKLASLGELVAGVAHEVNNPNHVVSMNVRFLEEALPSLFALAESSDELDEKLRLAGKSYDDFKTAYLSAVSDIETSAKRIDHIVSELKRFVRGSSPERRPVDVNAVVRSVVDLSHYMIERSTTRFRLELSDAALKVSGNFVELEQVVLNLIENACQSFSDGAGCIEVSTKLEDSSGQVCIEVHDDGAGIPQDKIEHITEPFFTTRADVGGSGLGLSIVNRIVRSHDGELSIESRVNEGTTVTVRLPKMGRQGSGPSVGG